MAILTSNQHTRLGWEGLPRPRCCCFVGASVWLRRVGGDFCCGMCVGEGQLRGLCHTVVQRGASITGSEATRAITPATSRARSRLDLVCSDVGGSGSRLTSDVRSSRKGRLSVRLSHAVRWRPLQMWRSVRIPRFPVQATRVADDGARLGSAP